MMFVFQTFSYSITYIYIWWKVATLLNAAGVYMTERSNLNEDADLIKSEKCNLNSLDDILIRMKKRRITKNIQDVSV